MYQSYFLTIFGSKVWQEQKAQNLPDLAAMMREDGRERIHLAKVDRPHEAGEVTEGENARISA